ncbi:hypothetical protein HT819_003915 [Salmonella enterica]|nr:hypothetical protein [Salmonella enterica]
MKTKIPNYYEYLHNRTPDQAIKDAKDTIADILKAVNGGELVIHPFYHACLRHAVTFIADYEKDLENIVNNQWSNNLARKKLTIILWWYKVLVRIDHQIDPIQVVFEGCTDCPRMLSSLLGIPQENISKPLEYVEINEPCPECGCTKYLVKNYLCMDCALSGDRNRYDRAINNRKNSACK